MNHFHKALSDEELFQCPASKMLLPLLDALNWNGNRNKLYQLVNSYKDHLETEDIVDIMAALGFEHDYMKDQSPLNIDNRMLPVLIVGQDNYYVLVQMDDCHGLAFNGLSQKYEQIILSNISGDIYAFVQSSGVEEENPKNQSNWFLKLVMRFSTSFKQVIFLTLATTLLGLLVPLFVILIYDQIGSNVAGDRMFILLIGVILYFAAGFTIDYMRGRIMNYMSVKMGAQISKETFKRLLYLTPGYTETASINAQISRIKDFENLKRFVNSGFFISVIELVFSLIYVVAIFLLGGWIGVVPIVTLLLVMVLSFMMKPFNKINSDKVSVARSDNQRQLLEILRNTTDIKMSGMKNHWLKDYRNTLGKYIHSTYDQSNFVSGSNNLLFFVTNASVVVLIYGGVLQVFDGVMTTGALIGCILLYWRVLSSIRGSSSLLIQVSGLSKSIQQVNRFMKLPQDSTVKENMVLTKELKGKVMFKDVSIRYSKTSKAALINLNFKLEQGQVLGVKGHDGAGKTTILKLIMGMYYPQGGRIIIDNFNIKQLEPLTLRQGISYCPEKDMIFVGSIRSNFHNVNPRISDETIMDICRETGLKDYLNLYQYDLDTYLSQDIIDQVSPSFKKLMSISRLLARDVKLYLIDEPENFLNVEEIERVNKVIKDLSTYNKTVIVVTKSDHLLDTCDTVLELNQGRGRLIKEDLNG